MNGTCESADDVSILVQEYIDDDPMFLAKSIEFYNIQTKIHGSSLDQPNHLYVPHQDMKYNNVYEMLLKDKYHKPKPFFESRCELSGE